MPSLMSGLFAIDFSVTCGTALVDETFSDVVVGLVLGRNLAGDVGFLLHAFRRVGEQIVRIACRHEPRAREGQRDAARVDRNPTPTPLFGHIRRRPRTAGWVENEIA